MKFQTNLLSHTRAIKFTTMHWCLYKFINFTNLIKNNQRKKSLLRELNFTSKRFFWQSKFSKTMRAWREKCCVYIIPFPPQMNFCYFRSIHHHHHHLLYHHRLIHLFFPLLSYFSHASTIFIRGTSLSLSHSLSIFPFSLWPVYIAMILAYAAHATLAPADLNRNFSRSLTNRDFLTVKLQSNFHRVRCLRENVFRYM